MSWEADGSKHVVCMVLRTVHYAGVHYPHPLLMCVCVCVCVFSMCLGTDTKNDFFECFLRVFEGLSLFEF